MSDHPLSGSVTNGSVAGDSNVPEVRIEIRESIGGDLHLRRRITVRVADDDSTAMIVDQTLGLGAQAVGAVMAVALGNSSSKWPLYFVELSIIIGLSFTYAAIPLRQRRPDVSAVAAKIGAIATAAAIIVSAASRLPLPVAFAVTPFAVLVVSAAVVYA